MYKLTIVLSILFFTISLSFSQSPNAYKIYDKNGEEVKWSQLKDASIESKVVLFGEQHDNLVGHWLQYELSKSILEADEKRILGAEMFEFDQQRIIDEYMDGYIVQSSFEEDVRKWSNYEDYKPLIELAKSNKREFIATNIPRRYARTVYYYGLDTLETIESSYSNSLPELPIEIDTSLESYAALNKGMGMHGASEKHLLEAQAIKDAVMGHNICESIRNDKSIIHFNGNYHSDKYEGIAHYIKKYCEPTVTTISMKAEKDCKFPESSKGTADFIIVTNPNISKSYE